MKQKDTQSSGPCLARGFAALGHHRRLEILQHLLMERSCNCKQVVARLDLAQSTVSQHLKVLVDAGLVRQETQGQRSIYTVDVTVFERLQAELQRLSASCVGRG